MPFLSTPSFDLSAGAEPTLGPRSAAPPPPPTAAAHHQPPVSEAAARRLREAEERLREAIEELHRHQGGGVKGDGDEQREGERGCGHDGESCAAHAAGNLCQSFLLSYGVRVGIGILLRAFKLVRRRSYGSLLDLKSSGFLEVFFKILAGSVAGLAILALDDSSRRRTLSLYLLARLAQCAYNSAKSKNKFHFWGSHWRHGDALLFSLACAQVMYAFVMRPESLPKSYQEFILKTGPVAEPVYKVVKECCRGGPVDLTALSAHLSNKRNPDLINLTTNPSIIPCSVIHPDRASCLAQNVNVVSSTFKKTFPLYFSLTFVPFVVLRLQKFLESPTTTCWRALVGAVRSTTFLSAFVTVFQAAICLHRKVANKDHKLVYWFAGLMSGLSILLEKKARRAELALYVLPRAGDSLWYILINRHLLPNIKNAEVALFCMCMGGIMYFLEYEPDTMAPFLRGLIRRFLASKISNPSPPPPNRNASYSYLQTLNALEQSRTQPGVDNGLTTSEKYNLESIPGL
ncbi:Transmembrane protein 135 [Zea mays]|uniref:Transmembrane protein 135 n=1 Tax=Zea mays TaxID=4577 RepID=A0A3L6DY88_MAIZE|nr:Mitochondrial import inner membrane translocase subunit Tim17/Tim22/Tim23 family protein [Zea mays]PWZ13525.1 Transmembrane protein 135 [Zea mays]